MGAYSTLSITREDAIKELISRVVSAPDGVLEDMLFDAFAHKTLYTFQIVSEYNGDDPDYEYPQRRHAFT